MRIDVMLVRASSKYGFMELSAMLLPVPQAISSWLARAIYSVSLANSNALSETRESPLSQSKWVGPHRTGVGQSDGRHYR